MFTTPDRLSVVGSVSLPVWSVLGVVVVVSFVFVSVVSLLVPPQPASIPTISASAKNRDNFFFII